MRIASITKGVPSSGSSARSRAASAGLRIGVSITGPGSKSMETPIPSSGVMMSANRMAASIGNRRIGCSVISAARSGVLVAVRKSTFWRRARYSGR